MGIEGNRNRIGAVTFVSSGRPPGVIMRRPVCDTKVVDDEGTSREL